MSLRFTVRFVLNESNIFFQFDIERFYQKDIANNEVTPALRNYKNEKMQYPRTLLPAITIPKCGS